MQPQSRAASTPLLGANLIRVAIVRPLDSRREAAFFDAADEATRFFMGDADVSRALVKLTTLLDELKIPYAIVGAMALNEYGYRRVTADVDVLMTREGLADFKLAHLGRGYVDRFPGSKGMRDPENGVDIDVLIAGEFPGDGAPKPIVFPDPKTAVRGARVALLPLERLVELKLASGMTAPHRLKDLADVLELVRAAHLPRDLEVHSYVRAKYDELWVAAQSAPNE